MLRPLLLLSFFCTLLYAQFLAPPPNITVVRVENRSPECPFNYTFTPHLPSNTTNSTFHISYYPSPYKDIRKKPGKSVTCRMLFELDFNQVNYTVSIQEAMFRVYINTNYGEATKIDMKGAWWSSPKMSEYTPINVQGQLTSFEEFASNTTYTGSYCATPDSSYKSATFNLLTTFGIEDSPDPWDPPRERAARDVAVPVHQLLNQTLTLGWESCPPYYG